MVNVGIVAIHSQVDAAGRMGVYTRSLVETLADHAPQHSYTVLVAESRMDGEPALAELIEDHPPAVLASGALYFRRTERTFADVI